VIICEEIALSSQISYDCQIPPDMKIPRTLARYSLLLFPLLVIIGVARIAPSHGVHPEATPDNAACEAEGSQQMKDATLPEKTEFAAMRARISFEP